MFQRSPFPVPYGWFQVAWSHDLAIGDVKPAIQFGRHIAVWRDNDGVAHVSDAFCPHLGAHFGHGGSVAGNDIVCPFHGWRFDAEGNNTLIPYSDRINAKARVPQYPTIERNGLVMAWYHPVDREPEWEIPEIPEFNDPDNYTAVVTREYRVAAPWQEVAENGVDAAHFRYVHNTDEVPELQGYEHDGPVSKMRSSQKFPTPRGVVEGRIDHESYGPGFSIIRFKGIVDTFLMGCNTPINEKACMVRFTFTVKKLGDDATNSTVGDAFVEEIHRQVFEDKPIWENKAHIITPALATTDGPFMKFRKWASQFYWEGIDTSAPRYEPEGEFPSYDPDRKTTASKRLGTDPFAEANV